MNTFENVVIELICCDIIYVMILSLLMVLGYMLSKSLGIV